MLAVDINLFDPKTEQKIALRNGFKLKIFIWAKSEVSVGFTPGGNPIKLIMS